MSRFERLIEILIKLQTRPRFTAQELADEVGVSRRTMLRDLQALGMMGVPLLPMPGPHGGFEVMTDRRLLSLALTVEEACGMLLSYESFLRYAQSPFAASNLSVITKLRNALPPGVVDDLDRMRRHIAVLDRRPSYEAPLLDALLQAALDNEHLRITYASRSGQSERVIYPFGLYAAQGFWYCACYDYRRADNVTLRADRVLTAERTSGYERRPPVDITEWIAVIQRDDGPSLPLRARVTPTGMRSQVVDILFGAIPVDAEGYGVLDITIPPSEIDYFAAYLLPLGTDLVVESPPELIDALHRKAQAIVMLYT